MIANAFGATVFALKDNNSESYSDKDMSIMTKYYFVVDWINAFLVQWLLLYLPYQWYFCFKAGPSRYHNYLMLLQQARKARSNLKKMNHLPNTKGTKPKFILP